MIRKTYTPGVGVQQEAEKLSDGSQVHAVVLLDHEGRRVEIHMSGILPAHALYQRLSALIEANEVLGITID